MTDATNGKILEENLREAMDLSRALWMLMVGLTGKNYPHQVQERDLSAIYQLAEEVRERTEAANHQWHEEE
jgi:hypothetical protein